MQGDVELPGQTADTTVLEAIDRSMDGTLAFSRAHSAEQEIERDGIVRAAPELILGISRGRLLKNSEVAPALLRGWSITPLDDRLVVEYASFKEGYICEACGGSGMTTVACLTCEGSGKKAPKPGWEEKPCAECRIVGADGHEPYSCGFVPCQSCSGSGLAPGVLAIPDASKQDHSYGDIISIGQSVLDLRPGDRVIFSKMAGIYLRGDERNCVLLRRGEVMGFMRKAG